MTTQPETLRLADLLLMDIKITKLAAKELRRLHEINLELIWALKDVIFTFEQAHVLEGIELVYKPLHPIFYVSTVEKIKIILNKATGETE
jgi:hypothetical protein